MLAGGNLMLNLRCLETWLLSQHRSQSDSKSEAGLTLIECLVAIIVASLVIGLTTPAVVISVATRVNSQKTEQAIEAAQAEVDRVRANIERGSFTNLPPIATFVVGDSIVPRTTPDGRTYNAELPEKIDGPLGTGRRELGRNEYPGTYEEARDLDVNSDGEADFAVQVFRSEGRTAEIDGSDVPVAFSLGVRVYDIAAFEGKGAAPLPVDKATAGVIGTQGDRSDYPLAVIYTTVVKSDLSGSLCDYVEYFGNIPTANYDCS